MTAPAKRPPATLRQQADLIRYLSKRCVLHDGAVAHRTYVLIDKLDAEDLIALAARLERMSAHEDSIRRLVTGK